ncbi:E3 SUMO-protein ligase SIZ1 [Citrus sinensis]|nr:E3 SUMO-protein ligase SIZ1 [Citrus sinensis]
MWAKKSPVSKEEVAKLVDDTHRKLQVSVAPDLASKGGQGVSNSSNIKIKGEMDDYIQSDTKVCCPCGSSLETESMIKCEDPRCPVWQHMSCVIIPEKPTEGNPPVPELFYCEICRLSRADPTNPARILEKTFPITRADKDLLSKQEYDVQAWCMLLNDKVPFRMQWPQYADLQVNGVPVRAINRPGSQLLGANGRDDGPIITPWTKDGINKIVLTGCDARIFCLGVRIVKRRSVQQVLNLIPKESEGEHFEDALARVCRCVGGGNAADNADSDSDLEVVADSIGVNLRCPMRNCGEDITELEVKPDGSWRVKTRSESDRREIGDLASWHFPDGSLCAPAGGEDKPKVEMLKHVRQEGVSEGHIGLKLGIRKNRNGLWEVSKPEDMNGSSGSRLQEKFENHDLKVIPMSSSATGSGRDGEDASVNQDVGGTFDFTNTGIEHDSMSLNVDPTYAFTDRNPCAPVGNTEVIVLSDSEDENDLFISSENIYRDNRNDVGGVSFSVPSAGIANSYPEDPAIGAGGDSCLGYLASNDNDFGMPLWPLPSGTQGGPGFQLFSPDVDVPDGFMDLQHGSINCSTPMNGYTLAPDTSMGSASLVPGCTVGAAADMSDALVDNPLAFDREDPSLQIFLPTRPSDTSVQTELRDQADVANGIRTEDWISLRLGDGVTGGQNELAAANGLNSKQPVHSRESAMDSLADTASLLLGMNEGRSEKASRQRSDSPFSFPRQKRSSMAYWYLSPPVLGIDWRRIVSVDVSRQCQSGENILNLQRNFSSEQQPFVMVARDRENPRQYVSVILHQQQLGLSASSFASWAVVQTFENVNITI